MSAPAPLDWARSRRLALREFVAQDVDAIVAMHREPRLREHLVDDWPLDHPRVAALFVERLAELYRRREGLGIWHASLVGPERRFAGWFNLMPMTDHPDEVEIGGRLLPQVWGSGLALEGATMLLDHAFDDLGHATVRGACHPENRSAAVVLLALGFEPLGTGPYEGGTANHFRIGLNDWRAARNTAGGTRLRRALRRSHAPVIEEPVA